MNEAGTEVALRTNRGTVVKKKLPCIEIQFWKCVARHELRWFSLKLFWLTRWMLRTMMWFWTLFWWFFCVPNSEFFFGASVFRQSRWLEAKQILYLFFSVIFFFSIGQGRESWGSKKPYCKRFPFLCFLSWPLRWALGPSWIFKAFILEFGVQVLAYRRRCAWTKMPIRDGLVGWVVEKMETCDMTLE